MFLDNLLKKKKDLLSTYYLPTCAQNWKMQRMATESSGLFRWRKTQTKTKTNTTKYIYTQLTFEQQEFELCGSTYTQIFLNSKYYSTTWSADAESMVQRNPRYGKPTINYIGISYLTEGQCPKPYIFQGSTVYIFVCLFVYICRREGLYPSCKNWIKNIT